MTTRLQTQRFSTTNTRPGTTTRPSGEVWLNFPDLRLGMIDPTQTAVDLLAVRNYAPSATYALGDYAVYSGQLQRAKTALTPHAYTATEWDPVVTQSYTDGAYTTQAQNDARYVRLSGSTMTGLLTLSADPVAALNATTKQYTDAQNALKLNLTGGTLTGPLVLAGPPTTANGAATKGYIDTLVGNYLPLTGGVVSGTLRVSNGRLISSGTSNPSVTVWDTAQNYAAGMFLGAGNTLYFGGMDGTGAFTSTFGYFDSGGALHAGSNVYVGNDLHAPHIYADTTLGVNYSAITGHWFAFGWNGNVNLYVNGGYQGDIATTSWVNSNFATYSWANSNFYSQGTSDARYLYKSGDTCSGNLDISGTCTIHGPGAVGGGGFYYYGTGATDDFSFYMSGVNVVIRVDSAYDAVIGSICDERLKRDIAPTKFDALAAIQSIPLYQYRNRPEKTERGQVPTDDAFVPIGFVADRLTGFPEAIFHGEHIKSLNTPVLLAALVGAVQQLAKERHA